MGAEGQRILYD
ncbi:unnamed protein product, partial [Cuscuta epithymum]